MNNETSAFQCVRRKGRENACGSLADADTGYVSCVRWKRVSLFNFLHDCTFFYILSLLPPPDLRLSERPHVFRMYTRREEPRNRPDTMCRPAASVREETHIV